MTSLTDVYEGGVGTAIGLRRRLLGAGVFVLGAAMVVGAIPVATTDLAAEFGLSVYEARELAGVLAGLGVPATFVGIVTVLPAGRVTRAAAAIGASIAVFGVAVFVAVYPYSWLSNAPALAISTTVIYSLGVLVTFWCLFVGLATFRRRKRPGGTARVEITDEGTVRVVTDERDSSFPGFGSVGLFGSDPDGEAETQTNRDGDDGTDDPPDPAHDDATILTDTSTEDQRQSRQARPASDGAGDVQTADTSRDGAGGRVGDHGGSGPDPAGASVDVHEAVRQRGRPDEYCGNCQHFEYVRANGEMAPYCGFHAELLEDMDACEQWEPNS